MVALLCLNVSIDVFRSKAPLSGSLCPKWAENVGHVLSLPLTIPCESSIYLTKRTQPDFFFYKNKEQMESPSPAQKSFAYSL